MGAQGLISQGVPPLPRWLLFVKGAIILLSVIVLALAAYAMSLYSGLLIYSGGAPGYLIFDAIVSWIVFGISLALELKAPQYYYRIALLIPYVLLCIFWLSGWAWAASWAGVWLAYDLDDYYGYNRFGGAMAGCAAIGAIVWVLCIVNLIFFIMACVRNPSTQPNVELGQGQKYGEQPGYPQQPQQQNYPQQAYATQ
ncbi:hypothetical protein BX600DRAFT_428937 [Xylariales sp. PMI_506]|nr:hypothetical protein BX600DRAFT_428937 [Xylariales sp. PMI_506]